MSGGGPANGHRAALFKSLPSHQIAELVGTQQEDPLFIDVDKEGQLEQLSEEIVKQVEEAQGEPSRPKSFYGPDLDLDSSLESETGSPRLCRRRGVEVVGEKEAMALAELSETIEELEAAEIAPQGAPASSRTAAESVTTTIKNARNIVTLLQRCNDEGGRLEELAEKAEPILKRVLQAETEQVLVRAREVEALQQLGHDYMLALANQMAGASDRSEALKLNRKIVWAGCVLDAFIPVIESQGRPLSDEEQRILAAGGSTAEPGTHPAPFSPTSRTCAQDDTV